ncbi:MAG: hypothetical protein OXH80_08025, partial [Nitrospira sp.]|nr:hypothetical protein [Nitrospira sp.]
MALLVLGLSKPHEMRQLQLQKNKDPGSSIKDVEDDRGGESGMTARRFFATLRMTILRVIGFLFFQR